MAYDNQPQMVQNVAAPQHYTPPSARDLRAQAVHRLQIGLFGLAAMLLLVGLANIIMERALRTEALERATPSAAGPSESAASDPLADIGVAPASEPTATPPPATNP
jgi:serine/threonine protein kinase HipA of HipAB toxin-antitoxin module